MERVYIYEVTPLLMLDLDVDVQNSIIMSYREFLKNIDYFIQIHIRYKKLDIQKYIERNFYNCNFENNNMSMIYSLYIDDLIDKLQKEDIYESKIYITVSVGVEVKNIEFIEQKIYTLEKTGCKVSKVIGHKKLEDIIYSSINKV